MATRIVRESMPKAELVAIARQQFGDLVKAVIDVRQGIMAVGGELHADEEALLIEQGSRQEDLWGIDLYPGTAEPEWIEFDSMINVRPSQGNSSRSVEDEGIRKRIAQIANTLIQR